MQHGDDLTPLLPASTPTRTRKPLPDFLDSPWLGRSHQNHTLRGRHGSRCWGRSWRAPRLHHDDTTLTLAFPEDGDVEHFLSRTRSEREEISLVTLADIEGGLF